LSKEWAVSNSELITREQHLVAALARAQAQHVAAQLQANQQHRADRQTADRSLNEAISAAGQAHQSAQTTAQQLFKRTTHESSRQYDRQHEAIEQQFRDQSERIQSQIEAREKRARGVINEARWLARAVFDAQRKGLKQQWHELDKQLRGRLQQARSLDRQILDFVQLWRARAPEASEAVPLPEVSDKPPQLSLDEALQEATQQLEQVRTARMVRFFEHAGPLWLVALLAAILLPTFGWWDEWQGAAWVVRGSLTALVTGTVISFWLRRVLRRRITLEAAPVRSAIRQAEAWHHRCQLEAHAHLQQQLGELRQTRDADIARATTAQAPVFAETQRRRTCDLPQIESATVKQLAELTQQHEAELQSATQRRDTALAQAQVQHAEVVSASRSEHVHALRAAEEQLQVAQALADSTWQKDLGAAQHEHALIHQRVAQSCPPFRSVATEAWQPPRAIPPVLRVGQFDLDLRQLTGGSTRDSHHETTEPRWALPAMLAFPEELSLCVTARGAGREVANQLLRVLMLRLLTSIAPGKVRFTLIDPAGLGQTFASFMHLADFDEELVGHRIWTEPGQIESRLADLTEHMETVIQMYLRDEFATLDQYNQQAGEIAEPYRVLVVASFPAGFTESSARRLLRIAACGRRCGVHVLVSVDSQLPPLPGIDLADLRRHATVFRVTGEQLEWHDPQLQRLGLQLDELPPPDELKQILHRVGAAAVDTKRVEVPFEAIAPLPSELWAADSRSGIDVPLGRAGATRLQYLRLGQGTAQHVLIAGKTGSGKSTLLHALITNAALRYSPDELELYLIDFKKGVEFKAYVTHGLPHARVIAIESEREFGLSVMQRLDRVMQERGELFRHRGAQDIAGYRQAGFHLPRILLVVDEFQEFFVEDDKLAQEAALLLDRLVRQGRAFGIHIHLGSQTLSGAYTLARSTLGQMAVRVALQCSESDAHLVLSEGNTAARLLSRPGEAIYNDANGLVEGNHAFQVVWLPDDQREHHLKRVAQLAMERPPLVRRQPVVFEGAQPAELERNAAVEELMLEACDAVAAPRVWLGEPLAIDALTSATLDRRGGANLLLLGHNDEAVAGMLTASLASLASQIIAGPSDSGDRPRFVLLHAGALDSSCRSLGKLAAQLPHDLRTAEAAETSDVMRQFSEELARRRGSAAAASPWFLFVVGLGRLPQLRRREDDFRFGREEAPPSPDRQFAELLREGPAHGLHVICWCDTLSSFQRTLDRPLLREFGLRVLCQMSAADSSMLIDTPAASQLGHFRAILHEEDQGRIERFRPFHAPSDDWLIWVGQRLRARSAQPPTAERGPSAPPDDEPTPSDRSQHSSAS